MMHSSLSLEADYKKQTGEESIEDVMLIAVLDGPKPRDDEGVDCPGNGHDLKGALPKACVHKAGINAPAATIESTATSAMAAESDEM